MREIYYTLFLNLDHEFLIYTSIAEVIVKGYGTFHNGRLKLTNKSFLSKYEREILEKINIDNMSKFHWSDCHKWIDELIFECFNSKYFKLTFFGKIKPTLHFKKAIQNNLNNGFNKDIVNYLITKDRTELDKIVPEINKIHFPLFVERTKTINDLPKIKDKSEILSEAVSNRFGFFNTESWKIIKKNGS